MTTQKAQIVDAQGQIIADGEASVEYMIEPGGMRPWYGVFTPGVVLLGSNDLRIKLADGREGKINVKLSDLNCVTFEGNGALA